MSMSFIVVVVVRVYLFLFIQQHTPLYKTKKRFYSDNIFFLLVE